MRKRPRFGSWSFAQTQRPLIAAPLVLFAALLAGCPPQVSPPPNSPPVSVAPHPRARGGSLTVHFLDVGQGDAAVVETSDHKAILIDAGPRTADEQVWKALRRASQNVFEMLVLSHPHADHMGVLDRLLASGGFHRFVEPGIAPKRNLNWGSAVEQIKDLRIEHRVGRRGDLFSLGEFATTAVLSPSEPLFTRTRSNVNANSIVLRIDHHAVPRDVRYLFEGDAEAETELRMLEHPDDVRADVLKVAHHGSRYSSSDQWLAAVKPTYAVISCGMENSYGHPHAPTLERLGAHHARIARTDLQGEITLQSDRDGNIHAQTERAANPSELLKPGTRPSRNSPQEDEDTTEVSQSSGSPRAAHLVKIP